MHREASTGNVNLKKVGRSQLGGDKNYGSGTNQGKNGGKQRLWRYYPKQPELGGRSPRKKLEPF